ncbi:acyltransferase [Streptomyces sp. NPDC005438]|uniref:acyltransferase n=1 Tax=Streptomyces sp. NPDC005438 TaxID=3156880 RepID=UPI0033B0AA9E
MVNEAVAQPQQQSAQVTGEPPSRPAREHRYDVDLMRLLCSCAVMLGHVGATFIAATDGQPDNGSGAYWVGHVAEGFNAFAVPMYFAIAGWAVLVGAPPADGARMWRRVVRNTVPLFVWTALYLVWAWVRDRNEEPMTRLGVDALFGSVRPAYHLWFMYSYIPIIVMLAFAVLVRAGQRPWRLGAALLAVALAPQVLGTLGELTGWHVPEVGWGFGTYAVVYAVGGALLFGLPERMPRRVRLALPLVWLGAVAGCVWYDTQIHYVIANAHVFVAAMTVAVLLMVHRLPIPVRLRPTLAKLANAALGAYLVHVFFVEELVRRMVSPDLSAPLAALVLVVGLSLTMVLSYAASLAWGALKLRRYLG